MIALSHPERHARGADRHRRAAVRGHRGADRRPRDRRAAAARHPGRDHLPRLVAVRRLPRGPGGDREGVRRRRLLPLRRPRAPRRAGPAELRRPHQGHAQGRRRERRRGRGRRACWPSTPRCSSSRSWPRPTRATTRCRRRSSSCAPGTSASEQELIEHCLGAIATFKVPRYVRFVEEWPMSGTKIQKFVLRERIADELRAAGHHAGGEGAVRAGLITKLPIAVASRRPSWRISHAVAAVRRVRRSTRDDAHDLAGRGRVDEVDRDVGRRAHLVLAEQRQQRPRSSRSRRARTRPARAAGRRC